MKRKIFYPLVVLLGALLCLLGAVPHASADTLEEQRVALENQLQQRVADVLSKVLAPNSYLVTVRVELENRAPNAPVTQTAHQQPADNPFLDKNRFLLPGVPEEKQFVPPRGTVQDNIITNPPVETLVRRIIFSILLSPDVSDEEIKNIRDFLSATIPFNPLRGDEMDIRASPLLKGSAGVKSMTRSAFEAASGDAALGWRGFLTRPSLTVFILLGSILAGLVIVLAFLFGPVRTFFNRLLTVLPRVGEQAIYAASNAPSIPPAATQAPPASSLSAPAGNGNVHNNGRGDELQLPFHFIGEDQLGKLPILFRNFSAAQAALVLAYLPPTWASRVLAGLDPTAQTAIMQELSRPREISAEAVAEIEKQIKEKLPYLVGGSDWVQSVYQLAPPDTQRVLLGTLAKQNPDLARALRLKTFFFEDLVILESGPLRVVVQEVGYPTFALALKGEKPEFREAVVHKLPAGIREFVQQELDLSKEDKPGIREARNRIAATGRRLLNEGRITWPERPAKKIGLKENVWIG